MSAHAAEIDAWVDGRREEIRAFLQELIRAEPEDGGFSAAGAGGGGTPPDAAGSARLVAATAETLGFEVSTHAVELDSLSDHPAFFAGPPGRPSRAYVAARRAGRGGGRSLVLNGHIDVVPAGDRDAWSHPPFSGALVNGDVWGRGASDAKGPFASGLFAAACAAELGLGGDLTIVAATDEELGGMSSLGSLVDGLTGDAVVVCEPTDLTVAPAGRGIAAFRVTVKGRHAHAGAAFQGVNAIVKAAKVIEAIDALAGELDRTRPNDIYRDVPVAHCFNVGKVQGGSWLGGVPDTCVIEALAPVIGDEEIDEIKGVVEAEIARVAAADEWLAEHPPQIEWIAPWFDPAYTPADDPFVRLAARSLERVTGAPPAVGPLLGGSDLRFYSRHFGIPGVHLGPGSMRLGHGPDELVSFEEVVTVTKALAGLIVDWCGCPCHGTTEAG